MGNNTRVSAAVRLALGVTAGFVVLGSGQGALAQEEDDIGLEEITVTGTRIRVPGVVSSSPIYSIDAGEIDMQQQPEIERILRLLPITKPDDGQNVNNGSDGAATVDLRGLGSERNLILIDGKRATPYSVEGIVDLQTIPTALIERIDIVTGGASAVYGSDAIAGALNFVMKKDFEGVDLRYNFSETEESDARVQSTALTLGVNSGDGRGNVVLNINWAERDSVLFGARPLGQLGIDSSDGSGLAEFLAGDIPPQPPAGCGGPAGAVESGGSSTTVPTRVSIFGGPGLGQFRDDRTLGSNCSLFNFNPVNQYQTPQQRWGAMVIGHYEINEYFEPYASFRYGVTNVRQEVAPSGVFGSNFFTNLSNPLIGDQARTFIIAAAEAGRTQVDAMTGLLAPTVCLDVTCSGLVPNSTANWRDVNGNGVVDVADDLLIQYRRRTVEFGNRTTDYGANQFQFVTGLRGTIRGDWDYDVWFSRGESDRLAISAGYTNVDAIKDAVRAVMTPQGIQCESAANNPGCVPIDMYGGFGAITPEMAAANSATGLEGETYRQTIINGSVSGPINGFQLPTAESPVAVSFGFETREEIGKTEPDECLKLKPEACLGGFGGTVLPVGAIFDVDEFFGEAYVPLVEGRTGFESLALELGIRTSDYSHVGSNETWKVGLNWRPVDSLLLRVMVQEATRAANIAEIGSPVTAALEDALLDPCSVGNAGNIDATLNALCLSTGMSQAQIGAFLLDGNGDKIPVLDDDGVIVPGEFETTGVEDLVSGQIDNISGSDPDNPPTSETADTFTAGFVWTPEFDALPNLTLSVDYYDIDIDGAIGELTAQEILNGCYTVGETAACDRITRLGGALTAPGSGTRAVTQNLIFRRAEGLEVSASFGVDLGNAGDLEISGTVNHYLTNEFQSETFLPVVDCVGKYGNSCAFPTYETRWIQRTSWYFKEDFMVSYLWRHLGSADIEDPQQAGTFPQFRSIDSYDYIDLTGTWQATDQISVSLSVYNLFGEDPPVVGGEVGTTASNSGNTFPSSYDVLGTVFTAGVRLRF